jgi:Flp pilus assembly protein TadG
MKSLGTFAKENQGLITVEFVCVIPMILAAMYFVFEFGRAFWAYEVASQDVRSAVRYLSRAESVDFTNTTGGFILKAENLAETGTTDASSSKHYPWTASSTISVSTTAFTDSDYNVNGSVISMTASIPITLSFLAFIGANTDYTISITGNAQYIGD